MINRFFSHGFFILALVFLTVSSVAAVELNGKISKVTGSVVTIALEGNLLPQIGDPVAINETIPDLGLLPLEGEWKVTNVTPSEIVAEPVGAVSQPQAGQIVVIQSSEPSTDAPSQADVKETYQQGLNYLNGEQGVKKDEAKALSLIKSAASKGYGPAQGQLGYMYSNGHGVAADKAKSFMWSRKAALQGHVISQYNVASDFYLGRGIAEDKTEATKWFRKAANQGHLKSQASMGRAYYNGYGVRQDYAEAASWYAKAAHRGNVFSQRRLGLMYEQGEGVPQDSSKAYEWYKKAAEQDDVLSQKQLGFMYWNGKGVSEDKAKAFYWFRKAARQGELGAQSLTAMCYRRGTGTAKDLDKAIYWYRKAAAQGDEEAQEQLVKLKVTPENGNPQVGTAGGGGRGQIPVGAEPMLAQIKSSDGALQQRGAKLLYRSSFKDNPAVLAVVQDELLKGCTLNLRDKRHVDAMAWLCNILGTSGDTTYQKTLKKVRSTTRSRKIKKYAHKNAGQLR